MQTMTATYSPEDNKLRLYSTSRLDAETYAQVKAAGFKWAPKQELFVAPMWTPQREDVLLELCGEIGDEDTSLVDRAEERADRFADYSQKRANDAKSAHAAVSAIADGIPLGQPILVGHHSEKRARKDAERIQRGMERAVNMWETSNYWKARAAGALRHAKYKELPGVRARRIKGLEADQRKQERNKADAEKWLALWTKEGLTLEQARTIANYCHLGVFKEEGATWYTTAWDVLREDAKTPWTVEQVQEAARQAYPRNIAHAERWIAHYENRIIYEKAMLEEQGASELLEKKPRPKQLPLCNYRAPEGIETANIYHRGETIHYPQVEMTQKEYSNICKDYKGTRVVGNSHRIRTALVRMKLVCVFLTDSKVHERPADVEAVARPVVRPMPAVERIQPEETPDDAAFKALKEQAKAGVKVVAAPQLFPTPREIAEQMAELADIQPGHDVLEPSAGTGNLIKAMGGRMFGDGVGSLTAVEINGGLLDMLRAENFHSRAVRADFLACNGDLGTFDRIVMNPPFENGMDIKHIKHALHMLRPGGVLVALCANGPRQNDELKPLATTWEDLPEGSFKEAGTGVRVALLTISKPRVRERAQMQSLF